MNAASSLLLTLAPILGGGLPAPVPATAEFGRWFTAASAGTLRIPGAVERESRRFRYVFVGGFCNERLPGYFAQNARELRARGIPRRSIHFVFPSSHEAIEANFAEVRARFLAIAREGPEELVIIAHSRGACDALAFALRDGAFVRDRVHALFLVQGPFGGTGLADYVTGEGPPLDRRMPLRLRIVAHLAGRVERYVLGRGKHGGLPEMTRRASRAFWGRMLAEHADAIPLVGPKTFYITTATRASRLRFIQRATAWYLRIHYGPNDGMVAAADQSLAGLGTILATLDAGHTDLTNPFPTGRAGRRFRRALVQGILMAVGNPATATDDPRTVAAGSR